MSTTVGHHPGDHRDAWATPGWFSSTTNEATDGKDPRGPAEVLGPFDKQRAAAEALIPYAERLAAEIAGVASEKERHQ